MMLYMDPPKHTRYRLLVNKGFTPRMIGLLEKYLTHRAILIVDNIIERGRCDFVEDLASELPLQAIAEIMGVPQEDRKLLFDWSNRMIGIDDPEYAKGDDGMNASMELYMYVNELGQEAQDRSARRHRHQAASTPRSTATGSPRSSSTCSCCCSPWPATRPPATPLRGACGR